MSIFTNTPVIRPKTNVFNLTHDRKFSSRIGELTPILLQECVPGDNFKIKSSSMVRFAPMIAPIMHRVNVYTHFFFVPNRLLWNEWEDFITGGDGESVNPVWAHGSYNPSGTAPGQLADYLGLPTGSDTIGPVASIDVNALPFAVYQKVWNDCYRDQNLQNKTVDTVESGQQSIGNWDRLQRLQRRAWQHDYLTSALPWTQKGPEAMLPLGDKAPIVLDEEAPFNNQRWKKEFTFEPVSGNAEALGAPATGIPLIGGSESLLDLQGTHYTDLSEATASSINDLRRAFKLQEWLEKNARGGSRYNESISIHFGIKSQDSRLQRPEFIGGQKTPVGVSEVVQTSSAGDQPTPQGNMAGHAVSVGSGSAVRYTAKEHGYIIGIQSIMPETAYSQGIPRHFSRSDKFDYYWPEFAHIGEQPILQKEVSVTNDEDINNSVFGYIPRYSEYKYQQNTIHGSFRDTLDIWHMARKFSTTPLLNEDFVKCDYAEVDRVFAVQDGTANMWCHTLNEIAARRPMPVYGNPKIM